MSEAGYCARALAAMKRGHEPASRSALSETILKEASAQEGMVVSSLREEGYIVDYRPDNQEEVELIHPLFVLKGHLDGRISGNELESEHVLEIKALGRFSYQKFTRKGLEAFPEYKAQISCYMAATGLPCFFVVKNRDTGQITKTRFESPPIDPQLILNRIARIELLQGGLPEGEFKEGSDQCRNCLYSYLCVREPEEYEITSSELIMAAAKWRKGEALHKEAEALQKEAKEIFALQAAETPSFKVDGLRVVKVEAVRETLQRDKLVELGVDESVIDRATKKSSFSYQKIIDERKK
jgi:hypothetical protein